MRLPRRPARPLGALGVLAVVAAVILVVAWNGTQGGRTPKAGAAAGGPTVRVDGRPNIVFVLTDDLSMNLLQYMPHVEALARAGMSFRHYYVVDSLCCPSRSAIFTGQYPHDDGVFGNGPGPDGGYLAYMNFHDAGKSFALGLQRAGYETAFMGKYLNGYRPYDPAAPGWGTWIGAGYGYREYRYGLNIDGQQSTYGTAPQDYLTTVLAEHATEFIHDVMPTGRPFALEVATFAPHKPSVPAPQDVGTFPGIRAPRGPAWNRTPAHAPAWLHIPRLTSASIREINTEYRHRVESVQAVDRMIGGLEMALEAAHQLGNTYFVFSSDNGYHMGEYRLRPGKMTAFDTDIQVPLIVAGPGIAPDSTTNAMASSIDLAPTFLQMADAQATDRPDGVSLLGILHGQTPTRWQRAILVEHHGPEFQPGDPDLQPPVAGNPPTYEAVRTARWLYVQYANGDREYYNLVRDPYELDNVYGSLSAARRHQLHLIVAALANCHGSVECQRAAMA